MVSFDGFFPALMQKLCEETSSLTWGHWQVGSLSPILLFALYTLVLLQLWAELPKSWKQIGMYTTWAILLIWGAMSLGYHRDTLRLTLLPIPEGDSICLRFPGRRDYDLVDGGSVMGTVNMLGGLPMHWKGSNLIKSSDRLPENQPLHGGPSREPWNKRRFLWLR